MTDSSSPRRWGLLIVLAASVAALLPFLDKPFHIDDPLFLWSAQQIRTDPVDFYGTTVNWYGFEQPLSEVTKNPPLVCYAIAALSWWVGFEERALHLAFLVPAAATIVGTFLLAARLGAPPTLAALLVLFAPAFLTSATSVMSDVPMLACFVWAVLFWVRGLEEGRTGFLFASGALVAAAGLAKYFGFTLVPLLALYALWRERRAGLWCLALGVPVAAALGYQALTAHLYGRGLLWDAADYATHFRIGSGVGPLATATVGLAFLGACGPALLVAPLVVRGWRIWVGALAAAAGLAAVIPVLGPFGGPVLREAHGTRWDVVAQLALHALVGLSVLGLASSDLVRRRSAEAALLFAWVSGTFLFATFLNWTINARTILPLLPPLAILLARRIAASGVAPWARTLVLVPAAALAFAVALADQRAAVEAREAAAAIAAKYSARSDSLWFQGHWGFQYYMQERGLRPLDTRHADLRVGDLLVSPLHNTGVLRLPGRLRTIDRISQQPGILTVMNNGAGSGFYTSLWGPLPWAIGGAKHDETLVEEVEVRTVLLWE